MIPAFILGLYFNSLTKQNSQNLPEDCDRKKLVKRIVISTVLMTAFLILVFILAFIVGSFLSIKEGDEDANSLLTFIFSVVAAYIFFALVIWIIQLRPLILNRLGLAIKKDFIQPNIGMAKKSVLTFEKETNKINSDYEEEDKDSDDD